MTSNRNSQAAQAAQSADVVVIGGGFAGLAAAVDLAEQGRRVRVLERRAFLGGRAYSFIDRTTGDTVDNGQHLMLGCYHRTLGFLEKIGARGNVRFQRSARVDFLSDEHGHAAFACPPLPAPLHLLAGLARLKTIGWGDRVQALRVGLALKRLNGDRARLSEMTVREWLDALGQSRRIQHHFWDLIALATLNEAPERASADMFARVLEEAFLHTRQDSRLVISRVGLSEMYTEHAQRFIEARGGEVRLNATVERIEFEGRRVKALMLRGGERVEADAIISAVPYFALQTLLPPDVAASVEAFRRLDDFKSAPIVSINVWYDEPVTDLEFVGLLNSPIEWVFNKNAIAGSGGSRQHLALVISGAHAAAKLAKEELAEIAVNELRRFFPAARKQRPAHWFVVREQQATLSHTVGVARLRPAQRTPFANFFLAGDWTDTGLPATIEGAVWSGQECARLLTSLTRVAGSAAV